MELFTHGALISLQAKGFISYRKGAESTSFSNFS